jgi:hypothetical protein
VLIEACRGNHVDFAAPAPTWLQRVSMPNSQWCAERRSLHRSRPGLLARQLTEIDHARADAVVAALISQAIDLGPKGPDKVYGNGLMGDSLRPSPDLAKISAR